MMKDTEAVAAPSPNTHTQVGNQKTDAGAIHALAANAALHRKKSARRRAPFTIAYRRKEDVYTREGWACAEEAKGPWG